MWTTFLLLPLHIVWRWIASTTRIVARMQFEFVYAKICDHARYAFTHHHHILQIIFHTHSPHTHTQKKRIEEQQMAAWSVCSRCCRQDMAFCIVGRLRGFYEWMVECISAFSCMPEYIYSTIHEESCAHKNKVLYIYTLLYYILPKWINLTMRKLCKMYIACGLKIYEKNICASETHNT